jgi:Flp pilus assembly protein TadD
METRDLLLVIGFLRSGRMVPVALPLHGLDANRSLRSVQEAMAEQEQALYGDPDATIDLERMRHRCALTSWSGANLTIGTRVGEVPDPGVVLGLLSDGPLDRAPLPVDITAQTLRRYVVRNAELKGRFDEHVDKAGTFAPMWLPPDELRAKSQVAFDAAMKVAREQGFALAAPLFEGVRGECFPAAQIAIAVYELRELGDAASALRRLAEVVRVAPTNVAARMLRAKALMADPGRLVEAASDFLVVLRELTRAEGPAKAGVWGQSAASTRGAPKQDPGVWGQSAASTRGAPKQDPAVGGQSAPSTRRAPKQEPTPELASSVREEATAGLWALHRQFADPRMLEAALALARQDPARGFEALSRYVHTHPCAWDAQAHLGTLALAARRFDVTARMLGNIRWLFPDDPNPHFVYGQALASQGRAQAAAQVLEYATALSPGDPDIAAWLGYAREQMAGDEPRSRRAKSIQMSHHVARSLLILVGLVRSGRVVPAVLATPKLPGDFPFAFAMHDLGELEKRLAGGASPDAGAGGRGGGAVAGRCALSDYAGAPVRPEGTIGEVSDPGVVVALLYADPGRDAGGRVVLNPPPAQCRSALLQAVQADSEISAKLERHLASPDATIKARLGSEGQGGP